MVQPERAAEAQHEPTGRPSVHIGGRAFGERAAAHHVVMRRHEGNVPARIYKEPVILPAYAPILGRANEIAAHGLQVEGHFLAATACGA